MLDEKLRSEISKPQIEDIKLNEIENVIYNLSTLRSKYNDEIHDKEFKVFEEIAESLFDLRVSKVLEGIEPKGFDSEVLEIINIIKKLYVNLLSGKYAISKGKILCKVKKSLCLDNFKLVEGDIVLIDIAQAFKLITIGYITPIEASKIV
jgi:hypothetical protein